MRIALPLLLTSLFAACTGWEASGEERKLECGYQEEPCMSREEIASELTYIDGWGSVVSVDDGPWIQSELDSKGGATCCYVVTYLAD